METPQNPQRPSQQPPKPNVSGNFGGLYAAITAEDEVPIVEERPQKHVSVFMKMVIAFMRLTFWIDLTKRSNEAIFRLLSGMWALVMLALYLSGIITFILCLTSFIHLPLKLENFFNANNIKYDSLEMADYSLSQINITNLHDEKNTYQIPQVKIQSTFGDFLKNKILAINADSVRINLKPNTAEKSNIQWMLDLFSTFNGAESQKLDVDSLTINNAVLTFSGKKITLPISFSLTGDYTQNAQTSVSFSVNEDFLKAIGTLSLSGTNEDQKLTLSITSGSLTLPDHPEEELTSEIEANLQNGEVQTATATFILKYAHSLKEIKLEMQKSTQTGFDGELNFSYKNTANEELEATPLTDFTVKFKSLQINEQGTFFTSHPLELNIRHLDQKELQIEGLETVLNGELSCQVSEGKCQYTLKKDSECRFSSLIWKHKNRVIVFDQNSPFRLLFNNKTSFILQFSAPSFQFDLLADGLKLIGYIDKPTHTFQIDAERVQMSQIAAEKQTDPALALKVQNANMNTPEINFQGAQFESDDVFDATASVKFESNKVTLNSPLIKKSFSAQMASLEGQTSIKCQILDSDIVFMAKGIFDLFKMTFTGNFMTSPINIQDTPFEFKELSDYIPQNLTNLTGLIILVGKKVSWTGNENISGQIWLGLKNISFETGETKVQNLNTVMALQSLFPLVSAPNQMLFIESMHDNQSLFNITSTYQINNRTFYFFNLTGEFANQTLNTTNSTLSFDDFSGLIYFKTAKNFKIDDLISYLNLPNLKLAGGMGSLSLPVEISPKGIRFSDLTFKINDSTLSTESSEPDIFNLFNPEVSSYYIRGGNLVLSQGKNLEANLEGWLLPSKAKRAVEIQDIDLPTPLFNQALQPSIPQKIIERLNSLFTSGNNQ